MRIYLQLKFYAILIQNVKYLILTKIYTENERLYVLISKNTILNAASFIHINKIKLGINKEAIFVIQHISVKMKFGAV